MGAFAVVALVLAVIGLCGVISYGVSLRRHELGVRIALSAAIRGIGRLIVGSSLLLVGTGVAGGVLGAWALTRLMGGLLFGFTPTDPLAFGSVGAILVTAGLAAAAIPARGAARVDPISVLKPD